MDIHAYLTLNSTRFKKLCTILALKFTPVINSGQGYPLQIFFPWEGAQVASYIPLEVFLQYLNRHCVIESQLNSNKPEYPFQNYDVAQKAPKTNQNLSHSLWEKNLKEKEALYGKRDTLRRKRHFKEKETL